MVPINSSITNLGCQEGVNLGPVTTLDRDQCTQCREGPGCQELQVILRPKAIPTTTLYLSFPLSTTGTLHEMIWVLISFPRPSILGFFSRVLTALDSDERRQGDTASEGRVWEKGQRHSWSREILKVTHKARRQEQWEGTWLWGPGMPSLRIRRCKWEGWENVCKMVLKKGGFKQQKYIKSKQKTSKKQTSKKQTKKFKIGKGHERTLLKRKHTCGQKAYDKNAQHH